jgi:DoxX-like family
MGCVNSITNGWANQIQPEKSLERPKKMKKNQITYWTTTGIVAAIMLWSAFNFSFNEEMKDGFSHLGLPGWFRIELTIAKILGALALLIPMIPNRIKEFAYFGFALTIISASIAHLSSGDGLLHGLEPLVFLGILIVSYLYYHKAEQISVSRNGANRSAKTPAGV